MCPCTDQSPSAHLFNPLSIPEYVKYIIVVDVLLHTSVGIRYYE